MNAEILNLPTIPIPRPRQGGQVASVQGTLALDLLPQLAPPEVMPACSRPNDVVSDEALVRRRVDRFVGAFVQAAVEVAVGDRPAAQLVRHTTPEVQRDLARRAHLVRTAAGAAPMRGRGAEALRPLVVGLRSSLVRQGALEVSARVRHGERSRAVAARFEVMRGRWQCVALEFA